MQKLQVVYCQRIYSITACCNFSMGFGRMYFLSFPKAWHFASHFQILDISAARWPLDGAGVEATFSYCRAMHCSS